MEDFVVTCQLAPGVPHLISGSCSSPRIFGLGFLQTPPRDDALALLLTLGSTNTWYGDSHPASYGLCPAHTSVEVTRQTSLNIKFRSFFITQMRIVFPSPTNTADKLTRKNWPELQGWHFSWPGKFLTRIPGPLTDGSEHHSIKSKLYETLDV